MGESFTVKLSRFQSQPWGFRLQGGKDFGTQLSIQRIQPESIAEKAGLQPGDAILKINDVNADTLRHKEAQDAIVRAGNNFELLVQRGAIKTWKPSVTALNNLKMLPKHDTGEITPVIKTSLAADKQEFRPIGSAHNVKAKPFGGAQINGSDTIPALVHKQYNSPASIYSMQNIADTLSSQAEVLASGIKGYNFMKTEPPINKDSAVYKMVKEEESTPPVEKFSLEEPTFKGINNPNIQSRSFREIQRELDDGEETSPKPPSSIIKPVEAPHTIPKPATPDSGAKTNENVCYDCGRLIVGVFVKIKDKTLHAECFKCNTCGANLKNVGYYNINDKLYCDIHARQVARQNPPAPNLTPVTVPPGAPFPTNLKIQPKPAGPSSPGSFGPVPFHQPKEASHVSPPKSPLPFSVEGLDSPSISNSATLLPEESLTPQTAPSGSSPHPSWLPPSTVGEEFKTTKTIFTANVSFSSQSFVSSELGSASVENVPKPGSHPMTAPTSNVHKQVTGTSSSSTTTTFIRQGAKFVWPPPRQPEEETDGTIETAAHPSAPTPTYRAPPSTQHTQYTPSVFKQSPTATPPPASHSPIPKAPSPIFPTPFNPSAAPTYKPVAPPTPITPTTPITPAWTAPSTGSVGSSLKTSAAGGSTGMTRPAPKRGRGILKSSVAPGTRIPICAVCGTPIRGPFVTALGKTWCPDHFICVNSTCRRPLQDIGFVEEQGQLYCEHCYETYLAPICSKCTARIKGDCLNAIGKQWHPECFLCAYCHVPFGNSHFYLEDGLPYCEKDWNELFTTKCVACGFAIEAGDRWVEALNSNFHSQCFKCTICHKNLEGQSFYAKGGRPFCKSHAR